MSGYPAGYDTKEDFDELMLFLKGSKILNSKCMYEESNSNSAELRYELSICCLNVIKDIVHV